MSNGERADQRMVEAGAARILADLYTKRAAQEMQLHDQLMAGANVDRRDVGDLLGTLSGQAAKRVAAARMRAEANGGSPRDAVFLAAQEVAWNLVCELCPENLAPARKLAVELAEILGVSPRASKQRQEPIPAVIVRPKRAREHGSVAH